jgi:hypothetical protein
LAFSYGLSEALYSHHKSHVLVPRVPNLVPPVQNRLQLFLHSQSSQFTSPQLDHQWTIYDWLRSSKVLLPPIVFWQRQWHCPLPKYPRAFPEHTAGLIPFEVLERQPVKCWFALLLMSGHTLCYLRLSIMCVRWDQFGAHFWINHIRRSTVVLHQAGVRCKPGCPVSRN